MQAIKKICTGGCNTPQYIWKNDSGLRFCKKCWQTRCAQNLIVNVKPTQKRIPNRSPKRAKQEREYSKVRKEFLLANPLCEARIPQLCTTDSVQVHHKAGRIGDLLTDVRYFLPVCDACHKWVELHPLESKELNLSTDRL